MLPPSKPTIKLSNYLLNLRTDIKLVGQSVVFKKWHHRRYKTFLSGAKDLNISSTFYRNIIIGKSNLPLWVLKKMCLIDSSLSNQVYENVEYFTAKKEMDRLPKVMSPKLAYYIGYLHGDGHVDRNQKRISFSEVYVEQLELIKELTQDLFNVSGSIYLKVGKKGHRANFIDIRRVTINSFFSDILSINRGKRESNIIPKIILDKKEFLRWYLCGLFDAESAIPTNPKNRDNIYIELSMRDTKLVEKVKIFLEENFGIKSYGPYKRIFRNPYNGKQTIGSELKIRKHSEIIRFLNEIGTLHPNKVRRKELIMKILGP